jgi:hypothetical protein
MEYRLVRFNISESSNVNHLFTKINSTSTLFIAHVKSMSKGWPHVSYLADFIEATAVPPKWGYLTQAGRQERAPRMHVSMIEFSLVNETVETQIPSIPELAKALQDSIGTRGATHTRLFVVEDPSRDVIEALEANLDIDPLFFSSHIGDYQWYNTRDLWVELPDLSCVTQGRTFWNVEYRHTRYFRTRKVLIRLRMKL